MSLVSNFVHASADYFPPSLKDPDIVINGMINGSERDSVVVKTAGPGRFDAASHKRPLTEFDGSDHHRIRLLPQVRPPPKAVRMIRSPL